MAAAQGIKDRDVDFLILQYLQKKGYEDAERVFRQQANIDGKDGELLTLSHQLDADNGLQDLLFSYAAESNPQHYVAEFDSLVAWVDSSLDLYKAELARVLYPVFVHVYLQLVQYGASQTAAGLLKQYRRRLVEVGGRQSSVRAQELSELQSVALAQHLDVNPFARAARESRSSLALCCYSFELLMHHLQGGKQWLMLNILNTHVRFELHEGLPLLDVRAGDEEGTGLLQGRAGQAAGAINAGVVHLGLLKDGIEDSYAAQKLQEEEERVSKMAAAGASAAAAAAAAAATAVDDGVTESLLLDPLQQEQQQSAAAAQASAAAKRLKAVREKALAAAKAKQQEVLNSRRPATIPLLPPHDKQRRTAVEDLEARVRLSPCPDSLPSCCFFTILNSRQALTALTVSPDCRLLASGFSDSMIRLHHLGLLGKQRGKLRERAEKRGAAGAKRAKAAAAAAAGRDAMEVDWEEDELQEELEDLSQQQVTQLVGHSGPVNALAFSADQAALLSASTDSTVRLWSTELRKGIAVYRGHVYPVWDVATCPLGHYLVSGGADRTARLWSTEQVRPLRIFAGHQSDVDVVAWHPNSHYVATGSSDRTVRLWDVSNGACCRVLTAQTSCPTSLAFSPDGRQLAAGTEDGSIAVYDLGSARRMALLDGAAGPVWSLSYSRGSGSLLAAGSADRTLRLFSMPHCDNVLEVVQEELAGASDTADAAAVAAVAAAGGAATAGGGGSRAAGASAAAAAGTAAAAGAAAAGGSGTAAGRTSAAGGSAGGSNAAGSHWQPYQLLRTFTTQATPVIYTSFSPRNLLLAGGPWCLATAAKQQQKAAAAAAAAAAGGGKA